jgi:hypothetical protein
LKKPYYKYYKFVSTKISKIANYERKKKPVETLFHERTSFVFMKGKIIVIYFPPFHGTINDKNSHVEVIELQIQIINGC